MEATLLTVSANDISLDIKFIVIGIATIRTCTSRRRKLWSDLST